MPRVLVGRNAIVCSISGCLLSRMGLALGVLWRWLIMTNEKLIPLYPLQDLSLCEVCRSLPTYTCEDLGAVGTSVLLLLLQFLFLFYALMRDTVLTM